jgi:hypothetical protein
MLTDCFRGVLSVGSHRRLAFCDVVQAQALQHASESFQKLWERLSREIGKIFLKKQRIFLLA